VQHTITKPRTVAEVLAQVEQQTGPVGRRAFEGFMREVAKIEHETNEKIDG
jgi:hypothetical protein